MTLFPRTSRRLVQVALDWTRPKDPPLSLGHASILAHLTAHHVPFHQKSWSVNHADFKSDAVVDFVMSHASRDSDFAVGAYVWNEKYVQDILKKLRKTSFPGRLIVGGPQVSYVGDNAALEKYYPDADVFIRGYAEGAMVQLIKTTEKKPAIRGVHYRGVPDLAKRAEADLEKLSSPFLTGLISPQPFIRWETQRGCPFRCSFCQHKEPEKTDLIRRHLARPRIEAEIDWIVNHPIIDDIAVLDPTFNSGPHHVETIDLLRVGGYTGKIALQCRADMVTPDFMRAIVELRQQAYPVLEFGLQTVHSKEQVVIGRPTNLKKTERVIRACLSEKIPMEISLIFGLPGQTFDSFRRSVEYCQELGVPIIHAFPLMLLRGTQLFDQKKELGLIESDEIASDKIDRLQHDIPHVVASHTFDHSEWKKMADFAAQIEVEHNAHARVFSSKPKFHSNSSCS